MRDLSLHILDLIENSIRAGAHVVSVVVEVSAVTDRLTIRIEDNGPGFPVSSEVALSPFFTTKSGKKTGLGLSLFRSAAERAGGELSVGKSPLGGALVEAGMKLSHVDRSPVGDLAATFASVICANPDIDLQVRLSSDQGQFAVSSRQVAGESAAKPPGGLALAREVSRRIQAASAEIYTGRTW